MNFNSDYLALALIPIISALIGWLTNWVAVKMLFRPLQPVRFLGMTFQGLVPRRQRDLAEKIGETVESNLISHRDIEKILQSDETRREVAALIEDQIDRFLAQQFASIPMLGAFLQGSVRDEIRLILVRQFQSAVPESLDKLMSKVEANLNFREIVRDKIIEFDLGKLETIIYGISSRELRAIEYLGEVLGFLIGLIQVLMIQYL